MRLFRRSANAWPEAWAVYPGLIEDSFAMYFVDLGACAAAPVAGLRVRLDAEVLLADTDEEDMPSGPELRLVHRLDGDIAKRARRLGGAYVGRVITEGTARYTCYLPDLPARRIVLGEDRPVRITVEADPTWSYASERLTPDPQQRHIVGDLSVINDLLERGDPLRAPRPVDHVGCFDTEAGARAAAGELSGHGFAVSVESSAGRHAGYVLEATRIDPVDPPEVHELTWTVREVCERHGGGVRRLGVSGHPLGSAEMPLFL
jgi:regulator of ribonuclease activity B/uncharacterized protein DUF695